MAQKYLTASVLLFTLLFAASGTQAAATDDAKHYADSVGTRVLAVVNQPGIGEEQKEKQVQQIFADNVDIDWMAKFVLGRGAQQATPEQMTHYMQAYRQYLLTRYTHNLKDYSGSKYTITKVTDDGSGRFSVHMTINSPNAPDQQQTDAGYQLQQSDNGQFKIRDIIIEGVSLITTQRSEFSSILSKNGLDALTQSIESKNRSEKTAG